MADTLADALVLFTKLNTNLVKRVEKLEKGESAVKKATETVEEADPVSIDSFSKKALTDLSKIIGPKAVERKEEKKPAKGRNLLEDILGMLGLAGAGLLALKDKIKEWVTKKLGGIIDDVTKLFDDAIKRAKTLLDDAWKGIKTFIDDAGKVIVNGAKSVREALDDAYKGLKDSKFGKYINEFLKATKEVFKSIGSKIGEMFDDVVKWGMQKIDDLKALGKTAMEKLATGAKKLLPGAAGVATAVATTVKEGAKKAASSAGETGGAVGKTLLAAGKAVAEKAGNLYQGAKSMGSTALSKAAVIKDVMMKFGGVRLSASILSKVLKRVPIVGTLFESFFAKQEINELVQKHMENPEKYTLQMLHKDIGTRISEGLGGILGGTAGASLGAIVGSVVPVAGNVVGAIGGGILGDMGGRWLGRVLGSKMGGAEEDVGRYLYEKFLLKQQTKEDQEGEVPMQEIQDGIITKTGELIRTHKDDTLYAMKNGGPFEKFFNKNNELIEKQGKMSMDMMSRQIDVLTKSNRLLTEMLEKLKQPSINTAANVVNNNFSSSVSLRGLQGA